jgi:hypothetical protein
MAKVSPLRRRSLVVKCKGPAGAGLWVLWVYFYCSGLGGVSMPGFGNIYRQCLCGFWWFGWLRGLDKVCGGGVGWWRCGEGPVSRSACGCAPAFGRAVGSSTRLFYGTAEAVPLRWSWWGRDGRERSSYRAMPTLATMKPSRRWVTQRWAARNTLLIIRPIRWMGWHLLASGAS